MMNATAITVMHVAAAPRAIRPAMQQRAILWPVEAPGSGEESS